MQFSLDRKRRSHKSHKQNQCSASDSVGLIFTRSYRSTLLITTLTTTPSLVKTSLRAPLEWLTTRLILRVTLRWTSIPSRVEGSRNKPGCLPEIGISFGDMDHLACHTLPLPVNQSTNRFINIKALNNKQVYHNKKLKRTNASGKCVT